MLETDMEMEPGKEKKKEKDEERPKKRRRKVQLREGREGRGKCLVLEIKGAIDSCVPSDPPKTPANSPLCCN